MQAFADVTLAAAVIDTLDRLVHHATVTEHELRPLLP
jgi:hypothetical protein